MKNNRGRKLFIITGISGAGKSQALKCFEDFGFYCVDNLPIALLDHFAELLSERPDLSRVALGIDIREGKFLKDLEAALAVVREKGFENRILFLDATPTLTDPMQLSIGKNVKEQVESDLKLEIEAVALYNKAVRIARDEGDNASAELFERLLKDEEEHVDWLEAQVYLMKEIGYERYLSQQIREEK